MAITRTPTRRLSPRSDLEDFNALVNRFFGPTMAGGATTGEWAPAVNVKETADGLELSAELPGMMADDVEIEFENNVLTIRGEKSHESEEGKEGDRYHIWERRYGSFQRSFTLPRTVDSSGIEASFDNGVLHVMLPKAQEAKSRKITVKAPSA